MQWTANKFLQEIGLELSQCQGVELEFSILLTAKKVEKFGRFCLWLKGKNSDFTAITKSLKKFGAPQEVIEAQQNSRLAINQAIGVSFAKGQTNFRFYLHSHKSDTLANYYQSWRWNADSDRAEIAEYDFHFLPETALGQRPLDFINPLLHSAFATLLNEKRLQQGSGFWLRQDANKKIEQIDLAFPWNPCGKDLQGLTEISQLLEISAADAALWQDLPIKHVASKVDANSASVTLYAAAPLSSWPQNEAELQEQVRQHSHKKKINLENFYQQLPALPAIDEKRPAIDYFYGGEIATWQKVLGENLHYHAGFFEDGNVDLSDAEMDLALNRAVKVLYPFITQQSKIYDIGCGWGGPLAMFIRDLKCHSLGLTVSKSQFQYISKLGLPVRWGDAEKTTPPGYFDCITLIESFCHIENKARLLQILRGFTNRLIIRLNCQDASLVSPVFGGSMHMISSNQLRNLLEENGWKIIHWQNQRLAAMPSVAVWNRRLKNLAPSQDYHLEIFRNWTKRVLQDPQSWAQNNPLIEVVVDKSL